jgi:hypothetical protein
MATFPHLFYATGLLAANFKYSLRTRNSGLFLVAAHFVLFEDEYGNRQRQTDHGHLIANKLPELYRRHRAYLSDKFHSL